MLLDEELNGQAVKYNHFELKNIAFDEKKFPNVVLQLLCSGFLVTRNSWNKRRIGTASLINFVVPNTALIRGWRLFE